MEPILPVGKIPRDLLERLLARAPVDDPRVLLGPGIGLDCAVVEMEDRLLVLKSDPVTFATEEIGVYAIQINANDIATTGAEPKWLLATLLLPEGRTTAALAEEIFGQLCRHCRRLGIALLGGHSEITYGLQRPVVMATMVGEVARDRLVTPRGASPGDRILLTKGVPIEATAVLARERPERLRGKLSPAEIDQARRFLAVPGIGVVSDARIATAAGRVSAMHDPTEGGVVTALWELAEASGRALVVDPAAVPVPSLSDRICRIFGVDPLETLASGALLLTASPQEVSAILVALDAAGIHAAEIGEVLDGPAALWRRTVVGREWWPCPERDGLAAIFERGEVFS
jgi:hydrogenase expression/formation protein HypE